MLRARRLDHAIEFPILLIESWRGAQAGNFDAVVDAVAAVADFAMTNGDTLAELDVNPLLVLPDRTVAADAVVRLAD